MQFRKKQALIVFLSPGRITARMPENDEFDELMGLSMSYLKRAMAATVARWTESLQLLNKALQKVYNHDAMIDDEHREVSKLNKVHNAPREFMEDVCGAPGKSVEANSDRELLPKLGDRITETSKELKESTRICQEHIAMVDEFLEFSAIINEHGLDYVVSKGLCDSYLERNVAASRRSPEALRLLNEGLVKEAVLAHFGLKKDELRGVSKRNKVRDAPREFVEDVCDVPTEFVEDCQFQ